MGLFCGPVWAFCSALCAKALGTASISAAATIKLRMLETPFVLVA
jgi:hypothetical protein